MLVHFWSCSALLWCSKILHHWWDHCSALLEARQETHLSPLAFLLRVLEQLKHLCQSSAVQYGYSISSATGSDTLSKVAWFGSQGLSALK